MQAMEKPGIGHSGHKWLYGRLTGVCDPGTKSDVADSNERPTLRGTKQRPLI